MKVLFVDAKSKVDSIKGLDKLKIKEKSIGLIGTVQTLFLLDSIKNYLVGKGHEVHIGGQVVGCNASNAIKINKKVDSFLFIGSGLFHPIEMLDDTEVESYYKFNPITLTFSKLMKSEVELMRKKKMAKLSKFYMSEKIGVAVSTKPGQENLDAALKFIKDIDKKAYIFVSNNVDINKLEDFNDIEYWVNTACPRLEEKGMISLRDIPNK
jgi:2-(3-amino-3-carboxypropyl)histidine synthase